MRMLNRQPSLLIRLALVVALTVTPTVLAAQFRNPPKATPMKNPASVTGVWTMPADTGVLAKIELRLAETGDGHIGGTWRAVNVGCSSDTDCQFHGPVFGHRDKASVELHLAPAAASVIGAQITTTLTAEATMAGTVVITVSSVGSGAGYAEFTRKP
jgi:hypothetical protein